MDFTHKERAILLRLLEKSWRHTDELRMETSPHGPEEQEMLEHQQLIERMMDKLR